MLKEAKVQSWKDFLEDIKEHNVWKKIYTYCINLNCMKKIEVYGIRLPNGSTTTSVEETINQNYKKCFPTDTINTDTPFHGLQRTKALENYSSILDPLFTTSEIDGVINSLNLNKSPGPDCIKNETLKRIHLMFLCFFSKLFNACLQLSTFPRSWKRANIFLIPKNNDFRGPHLDNLRCISLLPTIGKCLEKTDCGTGFSWFLHSKKNS
ncbi:Retrovirus-related Pol polyprotein type-1 like protein [Argiope bruennichi]|uniref:Retrovirus-related Pol polyprotein type-1 like protein n=1 Tax=Argiope bruennichi TaxID=94029 RepID=A0A8T0EE83_ARGBR|nr:Retrovirus-related Pol polyprotein type-1 like protein [Argiope bruennichi]